MSLRSVGSLLSRQPAELDPDMTEFEKQFEKKKRLIDGSRIKKMENLRRPRRYRYGTIRDIGFTTIDGYSYSVIVGEPKNPTSAVPLIETTAWFMGLEGYYRHEALSYMREGNFVVIVGAEGSHRSCGDRGGRLGGITLEKSASAVLNFCGEVVGIHDELDQDAYLLKGASRGAMVGMGIQALAQDYDKSVLYADLMAPCFPRPFNPFTDTLGLIRFLIEEPQTLVSLGYEMPLSLARRYHASIDLHPASLAHQLAITSPLFSGEAGELARSINRSVDPQMHITTFGRDVLSMHDDWVDIFEGYPGVRLTPLDGSHLALADKQTDAFQHARNLAVQNQIRAGKPIDAHAVSAFAHEHVEVRRKLA